MFVFVSRCHTIRVNKDEYPFTKIYVFVKEMKEFNIFLFSRVSVSAILTRKVFNR